MRLIGPGIGRFDGLLACGRADCSARKSSCPAKAGWSTPSSRSSCFGRLAVSFHFAAAASAFIALIDWNSFSATTARKLPSRTIFTTPGSFSTAGGVAFGQLRAIARRPHDAGMHHAGQPHILDVGRAAGDLCRDIDARHRLAHHLECRRVLQFRLRLRLHMQHVGPRRARHRSSACRQARSPHHSSVRRFSTGRSKPRGRFGDQQSAHLSRRVLDRGAAVLAWNCCRTYSPRSRSVWCRR